MYKYVRIYVYEYIYLFHHKLTMASSPVLVVVMCLYLCMVRKQFQSEKRKWKICVRI